MKRLALFLLIAAIAGTAAAQATYRWTDAEGRLHFTDTPPPKGAAKKVETMKSKATGADELPLSYATRQAAQDFPVILFVSRDCGDLCQQGRAYLKQRGIPFSEKDASTPEGTAALQAAAGKDQQTVPVLLVGKQVATGFSAQAWGGLLDTAGYPKTATPR